jgi:hypothetical protein
VRPSQVIAYKGVSNLTARGGAWKMADRVSKVEGKAKVIVDVKSQDPAGTRKTSRVIMIERSA